MIYLYCSICGRRYLKGESYCLRCGSIQTEQSIRLNPIPYKQTTTQAVLSIQELEGETEVLISPSSEQLESDGDSEVYEDCENVKLLTSGMLPIQFRGFNNEEVSEENEEPKTINLIYVGVISIVICLLMLALFVLYRELK